MSNKIKGPLGLGDFTPRTKSNLLEIFVSKKYSNYFINKSGKKHSAHAYMPNYYCIVCHVNMHCSGKTYSHFCIKHLANKDKKPQIMPNFPQKQKKIIPGKLWTWKHAKNDAREY